MTQYAGQAKLATTIPLTDANTPFNSSAVNAPDAANRDSIVALTANGFYATTLNAAKPPYPLAGDYENTGTYRLNGDLILVGTTKISFGSTRSYRRPCRLVWVDDAYWGPDATIPSAWPHSVNQVAATNPVNFEEHLKYEADVPPGASCVKVEVWVKPASGHAGLPATRPGIGVWLYDSDDHTSTLIASATADAATLVDYQQRTLLVATASLNTIAVPDKIIVNVSGETGANYLAGLVVDEPTVTFSTSSAIEP